MGEYLVAASAEVREGQILPLTAGDHKVLLTRVDGTVRACAAKCPHLGLPLSRAKVRDGAIVCPFHGSSYDLATGENIDWANSLAGVALPRWTHAALAMGKKPQPLPVYAVSERDGSIYVSDPDR